MQESQNHDLWEELEQIGEKRRKENFAKVGLNAEVLARVQRRGFFVKDIVLDEGAEGEGMSFHYFILPGTPAWILWHKSELPGEGKIELLDTFFQDAVGDPDDDHFQAQWPEYFPVDPS